MLFNSPEFIFVFLPILLGGSYFLAGMGQRRLAIGWVILGSLFFYGWFKPIYLLLILFSVAANFYFGNKIIASKAKAWVRQAKFWLISGLIFNLALLGYFKYYSFVATTISGISGQNWDIPSILLPIGISFYTFQQIAYLMDCHAGLAHRSNFAEYLLFVSYFPQLIAGPIVHPNQLLPQFEQPDVLKFRVAKFAEGMTIFILGLAKKVVLADQFAIWASDGFGAAQNGTALSFFEAWSATLSYTLQIYFDFSGYSDMAIGLAWMSGIRLPINFHAPYKASNIIEFWRRWHITLSTFLRDYLYIPLGGNRKGPGRRWFNLILTMVLGGLWHGAGWTFVFWGFLHGVFLAINHSWLAFKRRFVPEIKPLLWPGKIIATIITLTSVMIAWVFFRSPDFGTALDMLKGMAGLNGIYLPAELAKPLTGLGGLIQAKAKLNHLGGGSLIGLMEFTGFMVIGWAIVFLGKPLQELTVKARYLLLIPAFSFTLQRVIFSTKPSEFLYYQF